MARSVATGSSSVRRAATERRPLIVRQPLERLEEELPLAAEVVPDEAAGDPGGAVILSMDTPAGP